MSVVLRVFFGAIIFYMAYKRRGFMINYYYRSLEDAKLTQLDTFRTGSWVHVEAPGKDELGLLVEKFKLDPDLLRDALDPDEIPRIELEDGIAYVYMRYAYRRGDAVETDPVLLAVGPNFVATVTRHALPGLDRFMAMPALFTTQRVKLLLMILRYLVQSYETNINFLNRQIRGVRARLNIMNINNRDFIHFVVIEDALNSVLAELVPENLLLQSLLAGRYGLTFHEEDKDLIEDLVQGTRQLNETSRSGLRTIVNIREAYSNIMSNNLNRRVGILTSLTVVLTIPTIVFSLFGINVPIPGQHSAVAFWLIVLLTMGSMVGILYWLVKQRWL
jgi:magnesium transporter